MFAGIRKIQHLTELRFIMNAPTIHRNADLYSLWRPRPGHRDSAWTQAAKIPLWKKGLILLHSPWVFSGRLSLWTRVCNCSSGTSRVIQWPSLWCFSTDWNNIWITRIWSDSWRMTFQHQCKSGLNRASGVPSNCRVSCSYNSCKCLHLLTALWMCEGANTNQTRVILQT